MYCFFFFLPFSSSADYTRSTKINLNIKTFILLATFSKKILKKRANVRVLPVCTRMYPCVTGMLLVCTCMLLVCTRVYSGYIVMLRARMFRSLIPVLMIKERNIRARNILYWCGVLVTIRTAAQ